MARDPYTDDEYDETYRKVHGDDPVKDQYANDATDDSFFPSGLTGMYPSNWRQTGPATVDAEYGEPGGNSEYETRDTGDSMWDEGLISLLLVGGLALFLFPEPTTSAVGVVMMGVGVVAWLIDWAA